MSTNSVDALHAQASGVTPEQHPYIDDRGRRYTAAVLDWSPAARKALGIRPVDQGADFVSDWALKPADTSPVRKRGGHRHAR